MNLESDYTRKKLTKFLCQELLYEYVTHNLDTAREKEVTDYLGTCRDSQRELDNLNKGLRFAIVGAKVKISPALFHALENFEPQWKKSMRAWTLWSSQRGWRTLPYVFLAVVVATGILVARPWISKPNNDVTLAEQLKQEPDMLPQESPAQAPVPQPAASGPLVMAEPAKTGENLPDLMESFVKGWLPSAKVAKPTELIPAQPAPMPAPATPVATVAKVEPTRAAISAAERADPPAVDERPTGVQGEAKMDGAQIDEAMGRGYLFRMVLQVQDFQNSWPAIRDKVVALGGKVAGNVEMGWLRKNDESYFHFTLPESNMSELELFLGTFGPVQFSKDRHPRVMPEGQIRIIMSVKDGMTENEAPPETP